MGAVAELHPGPGGHASSRRTRDGVVDEQGEARGVGQVVGARRGGAGHATRRAVLPQPRNIQGFPAVARVRHQQAGTRGDGGQGDVRVRQPGAAHGLQPLARVLHAAAGYPPRHELLRQRRSHPLVPDVAGANRGARRGASDDLEGGSLLPKLRASSRVPRLERERPRDARDQGEAHQGYPPVQEQGASRVIHSLVHARLRSQAQHGGPSKRRHPPIEPPETRGADAVVRPGAGDQAYPGPLRQDPSQDHPPRSRRRARSMERLHRRVARDEGEDGGGDRPASQPGDRRLLRALVHHGRGGQGHAREAREGCRAFRQTEHGIRL